MGTLGSIFFGGLLRRLRRFLAAAAVAAAVAELAEAAAEVLLHEGSK